MVKADPSQHSSRQSSSICSWSRSKRGLPLFVGSHCRVIDLHPQFLATCNRVHLHQSPICSSLLPFWQKSHLDNAPWSTNWIDVISFTDLCSLIQELSANASSPEVVVHSKIAEVSYTVSSEHLPISILHGNKLSSRVYTHSANNACLL